MIIEPEFTPIVGNGDLSPKIATLSNNESLKKIKSENKNKAVFLLRMFLPMPFSSLEKSLKNLPYFKDY